jgi:hypothetical protein
VSGVESDPNKIPYFQAEFAMSRMRAGEPCERCGERSASILQYTPDEGSGGILCEECQWPRCASCWRHLRPPEDGGRVWVKRGEEHFCPPGASS